MADAGRVKQLYDELVAYSLEKIKEAEQYNSNTKYGEIYSFIKDMTVSKIKAFGDKTAQEMVMKLGEDNKVLNKIDIGGVQKTNVAGFVERFDNAIKKAEGLDKIFTTEKQKATSSLEAIKSMDSSDNTILKAISNLQKIIDNYNIHSYNDLNTALAVFSAQTQKLSTLYKEWNSVDHDFETARNFLNTALAVDPSILQIPVFINANAQIKDYYAKRDIIKTNSTDVEKYKSIFDSAITKPQFYTAINNLPRQQERIDKASDQIDAIFSSSHFNDENNMELKEWKDLDNTKKKYEADKKATPVLASSILADLSNAKYYDNALKKAISKSGGLTAFNKMPTSAKVSAIVQGNAPKGASISDAVKDLPQWMQNEVVELYSKKEPQKAIGAVIKLEKELADSAKDGYLDKLKDMLYVLNNQGDKEAKKEVVFGTQTIQDIINELNRVINGTDIGARIKAYETYKNFEPLTVVEQYKYNAKDIPNAPAVSDITKGNVDSVRFMAQSVALKNELRNLDESYAKAKTDAERAKINQFIENKKKVYDNTVSTIKNRVKQATRLERTAAELKGVEATKEQYAKEFKKKGIYDSATAMNRDSKPSDFGLVERPQLKKVTADMTEEEKLAIDNENQKILDERNNSLSTTEKMQSDFNEVTNNNSNLSDIDYANITNYRIAKDVNGFYKELQTIRKQIFAEIKKLSDDLRVKSQDEANLTIRTLLNSAIGDITVWASKYNYNKAKEAYDAVVPAYNKAKMETSAQPEYMQDTGEETRKIVIEQNKKDYPDNIMEKYLEVFKGKPLDEVPQDMYSMVRDGIVNIRKLFADNKPEEATAEYNNIIGKLDNYAKTASPVSLESDILKEEANKVADKLINDIEKQRADMPVSGNEFVDSEIERMKTMADEGNSSELQSVYNNVVSKIKQLKDVAKKEYVLKINARAKEMVDDLVLKREMEKDIAKKNIINKSITSIISLASRFNVDAMEQLYADIVNQLGSYAGIDIVDIADKFLEISKHKNDILKSNPELWANLEEAYNGNSVEFFNQFYNDAINLIGSLNKQVKPPIPQEIKPQPASTEPSNTVPAINNAYPIQQ